MAACTYAHTYYRHGDYFMGHRVWAVYHGHLAQDIVASYYIYDVQELPKLLLHQTRLYKWIEYTFSATVDACRMLQIAGILSAHEIVALPCSWRRP